MIRKMLAAAAAIVMCLSFASCGSTDSSGGGSDFGSPWGRNSDSSEGSDSENADPASKTEEVSQAASAPDETKAPESKAEESKAEESKAEEDPQLVSKPDDSKEETVSQSEVTPSNGSLTVKGTGYTVSFGEGWVDMAQYKDQIGQQTADAAKEKFGVDSSSFTGMDTVCMYNPGINKNAPVFNVVDPIVNAAFKSVTISQLEPVLVQSLEQQMAGTQGFKCENKGIKNYNGVDFLELYTEYDLGTLIAKARQFFAIYGDKEYVISFSISGDQYDSMLDETENIMKTFKFTEG